MRHEHKILLALVLVAALPAGLSGTLAFSSTRRGLQAQTGDLLVALAREAAGFLQHDVDRSVQSIDSVLALPRGGIARFSPEQREAFLSVVYHLFDGHAAAALIDPAGEEPVQQVRRRPDDRGALLERHPPSSEADAAAFLARIPVEEAAARGRAVSAPYRAADGDPRVAVAVLARSPGEKRYVLAAEVSLHGLRNHLERLLPRAGGAALVGRDGLPVLAVGDSLHPDALPTLRGVERPAVRELPGDHLAAVEPLPAGAAVVVFQDAAVALAAADEIFWQSLAWLAGSLVVALLVGFVLSRSLAAPVRSLSRAARRIGAGDLGGQVEVADRGELGLLARAFNEMSADLRRKQEEIEAWNHELQARVEAKTEEVRRLQKVASRAQRVAAMAGLSAGLAHEINNPLQSVLGMAQLARREAAGPVLAKLEVVEREARRIAGLVQRLLQLGEAPGVAAVEFDVDLAVDAAARAVAAAHPGLELHLEHHRAGGAAVVLGYAGELQQAFVALLDNAVEAAREGQTPYIEVTTEVADDVVRVAVHDRGRGIEPEHLERVFEPFHTTKHSREGRGLGLPTAHRAVALHGGEIALESTLGEGTTARITLPRAQKGTLLA
ncbi:MAG: HAMP domain-containing histidine kinase [Deltaproteobacteria bacterium]|nr:HAMP domain-containing histidine kinase [Deltaproteobacteria bacterium]